MTPTIGRIVHVLGIPAESNGSTVAPAVVTRVWSNDLLNVTVFPDAAAPVPATSVRLFDNENDARAASTEREYPQTVAFWPPRA